MGFSWRCIFFINLPVAEEVARASTAINIIQDTGAAIGAAILSVVLAHELSIRHLGRGGIGTASLKSASGAHATAAAHAFASTFALTLPLVAAAFAVAIIFLPKTRQLAVEDDDGGAATSMPVI